MLPLLRDKLKQLNPTILTGEARIDAIITKLRACRDNAQWLTWLKSGVNHQFDPSEKAQDVRLIDFDDLDANDWWVTNQFLVEGNSPRRPDLVLLINGIPGRRLQFWLQWRDPWPHAIDEFDEMKVSLYGLFDRANLLDFIRHFIIFVTKDGKTEKVVARYQ